MIRLLTTTLAFALLSSAACLVPVSAVADSVEIAGGGHLTGKVARQSDYTVVAIDDDLQVAIPNSRVSRVVKSDELAQYRRNAVKAGDNAELHYKLAIWCATAGNIPGQTGQYRKYHFQRAIELDPEHELARAALGYLKENGKWVHRTDMMRDRGMISVGRKWELPESVALAESAEASETESKLWIREVNRLIKIVSKRSSKSAEALEELRAIKDPLAALAIAQQLEESRNDRSQPVAMRRLWIDLLGRFKNRVSVQALVMAGVEETDETIREAALEQLLVYGADSASATYVPMLSANNRQTIHRAARALSWFPDPELAMTYVDALVTTVKTVGPPPPGMSLGFGDNGSNGMSTGGKAVEINDTQPNPAVLALLRTVEPDVDFGYNEQKWQMYLAAKKTKFSGDLRRDP
ncbi:MAG: HEAT repeat domain-containing protein [Rubripirellula sp.]